MVIKNSGVTWTVKPTFSGYELYSDKVIDFYGTETIMESAEPIFWGCHTELKPLLEHLEKLENSAFLMRKRKMAIVR